FREVGKRFGNGSNNGFVLDSASSNYNHGFSRIITVDAITKILCLCIRHKFFGAKYLPTNSLIRKSNCRQKFIHSGIWIIFILADFLKDDAALDVDVGLIEL